MASEPEGPPIEIEPRRLACPAHGEHLRANWPSGYLLFGVAMFQAAIESPELRAACRELAYLSAIEQIPPATINLVTERRPLCYFVPREKIIAALRGSGVLAIGRCDICGRSDFAGPYDIDFGGHVRTRTVCVGCACDGGERLHRAHPKGGVWHGKAGR